MAAETKKEIELDIGHVLFIDIVGYSKLLITEQSEQMEKLREIVRGTEQFRTAEAQGKLLRLPTGDGGALEFRHSVEAPVFRPIPIYIKIDIRRKWINRRADYVTRRFNLSSARLKKPLRLGFR